MHSNTKQNRGVFHLQTFSSQQYFSTVSAKTLLFCSMIYLNSIWTSSVQHGEDGQIGAQVGNCRTGGALVTRDMKPHCTLHSLHLVVSVSKVKLLESKRKKSLQRWRFMSTLT